MNLSINEKIERRFREQVFRRMGLKKGNLKKAVEQAMILWISADSGKGDELKKT